MLQRTARNKKITVLKKEQIEKNQFVYRTLDENEQNIPNTDCKIDGELAKSGPFYTLTL